MTYECSCDYDPPEWHRKTNVKRAGKQHRCEECGRKIAVGEPYERVTGQWYGTIYTFATCPQCVALREWAVISVPCFCWAHGSLLDDVREMVGEVRHDVPGFVMEWGRRMIAIRRAKQVHA